MKRIRTVPILLFGVGVMLFYSGCSKKPEKPVPAAELKLPFTVPKNLDFGDQKSTTLVYKAWAEMDKKNYPAAYGYAERCIELYGEKAAAQEKTLKDFPAIEKMADYQYLNDVGSAYLVQEFIFDNMNKIEWMKVVNQAIVDKYYHSQTKDNQGWFWKPGEVAQAQLKNLK